MSDLHSEAKLQSQIDKLRSANTSLQRRLDTVQLEQSHYVAQIYRAAKESMASFHFPAITAPKPDTRQKTTETAIAVLSDFQLGKKTPTYSTKVCAQRIRLYSEKVKILTDIQRADHPVRDLKVYLVGDIVEGELIFPGQSHRIDASLYRQVTTDGPQILGTFLRDMLGYFETVTVVCVVGNHGAIGGRSRKEYHPESNADAMLYRVTALAMKGADLKDEPRLSWSDTMVKGERLWYAVDRIGKYRYFLFHGDQMRGGGFAGIPHYGFSRAISSWASGVIPKSFDYAICGHWHQPASFPINQRILWVNGSPESDNEWLREELKSQSKPSQWLLFAHPDNGVTAEYRVWLDGSTV